jgi:paraquat-inducible protein B
MSKKANPKAIGLFVIGSLVLLVASVLMFSSNRLFTDRPRYVLFFQGSVQGLQKGSPVVFRGVRVGSVVDILMHFDPVAMTVNIPVVVEMESDRVTIMDDVRESATTEDVIQALIAQGLKGQLKSQSFVTGQLLVDFDFHPDKEIRLTGIDMGYKELPTIPSAFEQFTETLQTLPVQEIVDNVNSAMEGIEQLINAPEVMDSVKELNRTLKNTREFTGNIDARLTPVLKQTERTLADIQKLVQNVDGQVEPLTDDTREMIQATIKLLEDVNARFTPLLENINGLTETAKETLGQATSTLSAYEDIGTEGSPFVDELTTALEELTRTARSLRILLDSIENRPDEFIRGKSSSGGTR